VCSIACPSAKDLIKSYFRMFPVVVLLLGSTHTHYIMSLYVVYIEICLIYILYILICLVYIDVCRVYIDILYVCLVYV